MHFKRGKSSAGMGGRTVLLPLPFPLPSAFCLCLCLMWQKIVGSWPRNPHQRKALASVGMYLIYVKCTIQGTPRLNSCIWELTSCPVVPTTLNQSLLSLWLQSLQSILGDPTTRCTWVQILLLCDSVALGPGTRGSSALNLSFLICDVLSLQARIGIIWDDVSRT